MLHREFPPKNFFGWNSWQRVLWCKFWDNNTKIHCYGFRKIKPQKIASIAPQSLKFNKFPISNLWVDELKSQCFLHIKICLNFLLFGQFTEKHLYWILLLNKVVGSLKLYYKIDSGKTAFLLILQNFEKHFFYRIPAHSTVSEMYTLEKRRENIMFSFTLQKNFLWMDSRCRVLE